MSFGLASSTRRFAIYFFVGWQWQRSIYKLHPTLHSRPTLTLSMWANVKCNMHSSFLAGNLVWQPGVATYVTLPAAFSKMKVQTGTNNILFISIKGKKLISHNPSFICWFEEQSTSLEETHKRRLPLYNKWWNREFTLEKEWVRFALASQGNNSCVSFFMTKKALYVRFTLFGYVESLI